jgi:hypothetical protein
MAFSANGLSGGLVTSIDSANILLDYCLNHGEDWSYIGTIAAIEESLWENEDIAKKITKIVPGGAVDYNQGDIINFPLMLRVFMKNPSAYRDLLPLIALGIMSQTDNPVDHIAALPVELLACREHDLQCTSVSVGLLNILKTGSYESFEPSLLDERRQNRLLEVELYYSFVKAKSMSDDARILVACKIINKLMVSLPSSVGRFRELLLRSLDSKRSDFPMEKSWIVDYRFPPEAYPLLSSARH